MRDRDFHAQLQGFSLTTAEILYRLPDYPRFLQTYVWQEYDLHPRFPKLQGFLNYWNQHIDGSLYQVRVMHACLISPREMKFHGTEFKLQ